MFYFVILSILTLATELQSSDMMYQAAQKVCAQTKVATDQAVQQKAYFDTIQALGDYHYKAVTAQADAYALPAATQQYDRIVTAPAQKSADQLAQTTALPAQEVASQVVSSAQPVAYRSQEFPVIRTEQFTPQQQGDQHIAYGSLLYQHMELESVHMRAMQMQTWRTYVTYTRTSPQAHAFVAHVHKLFAEFNHLFDQASSLKEYQAAYGVLLEIEGAVNQLADIKPLAYVLSYDTYHAVKHMQSPLLDLFLGNKQALSQTDMSQVAWALHGYYEKMAQTFHRKPVLFPQGKLKQIIDAYYNSSFVSKAGQSVSHYMVKGYRDLTIAQKQQRYHQLLEQQHQFLEHACGIKTDALSGTWKERYTARERSANQALAEKSFYTRTYLLQESTQAQLKALGLDPRVFMQLRGNALQHTLQIELVKVANMAAGNKHALAEAALHFAHTGALCNQAGRMQEAWTIADISWTIADHMQAVGEGAWEGAVSVWSAMRHPINFTQNLMVEVGTACSELLCYRWHCLDVEARLHSGDEQAIIEVALLDLHAEQIKQTLANALSECSTRDLLKQGTKAFVDYKITAKLLQSFGKLLAGVKPHIVKPLLPATHPMKAQIPRTVYEATFDPATKAYVVESVRNVCRSAQEFKHSAPAEFAAQTIDQVGKGAGGALAPMKDVGKATLDTNRLATFKAGIQEAARTARVTEVCKPQHGTSKPATNSFPKKNAYFKDDLLAELSQFQGKRFNVGPHTFLLDRSNLKHILTRHHPAFWDGSVAKDAQSFFNENVNVNEIITIIREVMDQNREIILLKGTNRQFQIEGFFNGVKYTVGFRKGLIGQFYNNIG